MSHTIPPSGAGTGPLGGPNRDNPSIPKTDTITAARWLRRYWANRGWDIDLEIVNLTPKAEYPTWSIRSNLVNGYPPGFFTPPKGVKGPRGPSAPLASKM